MVRASSTSSHKIEDSNSSKIDIRAIMEIRVHFTVAILKPIDRDNNNQTAYSAGATKEVDSRHFRVRELV